MEAILDTHSSIYYSSSEELNSGAKTPTMATMTSDYSPPDFDFNSPCRNFKSSFARSLSLGNANAITHQNGNNNTNNNSNNNNKSCCRSLIYDIDTTPQSSKQQNKHISFAQRSSNRNLAAAKKDCPPPVPQRLSCASGTITSSIPSVVRNNADNINKHNHDNRANEAAAASVLSNDATVYVEQTSLCVTPPPVLPVRRSLPSSNGRKNACTTQTAHAFQRAAATMTHFTRQPVTGNSNATNNATLNGDIEPTLYGSYRNTGGSFRRNSEQQATQHVAIQAQANDKNNNNNGYLHGQHEHNNNNNNKNNDNHNNNENADDGNDAQQSCSLCNESLYINASAADITLTTVEHQKHINAKTFITPQKLQQAQQQQQQHQQHQQQQRFLPSLPSFSMKTLPHATSTPVYDSIGPQDNKTELENMILRNEIHKARWQLKQLDTRCKMQRDVIEEMARFLDRFHAHSKLKEDFHQKSIEQLPRSMSLFPIYGIDSGRSSSSSSCNISTYGNENEKENSNVVASNCLRARNTFSVNDPNSYNTFKDYTWRRSPKKSSNNRTSGDFTIDEVDMKLSQEAFRLSRTINNLLNKAIQQQPFQNGGLVKTPSNNSISTLSHGASNIHNSTSLSMADDSVSIDNSLKVNKNSEAYIRRTSTPEPSTHMNFLRTHNLRSSRLSMRSSTDSSVHSLTSSSTDEDAGLSLYQLQQQQQQQHHHHNHNHNHHLARHQTQPVIVSTTEDESGFSSISSFQEIGLPLTTATTTLTKAALPPQLQRQRTSNGNTNNSEDSVLWV